MIRKLISSDLEQMMRVYDSQPSLLKVKKTKHIDLHYKKILPLYLANDIGVSAFGNFDDSGNLIAFSTISTWAILPFATIGLFFVDKNYVSYIHSDEITSKLMAGMISYAESINITSIYSAVTINAAMARGAQGVNLQHKKDKQYSSLMWDFETDSARYVVTVEELIKPYSASKYVNFSKMLGILETKNSVPILIRKWSLLNRYRDLDLDYNLRRRVDQVSNINIQS
jgi:hypothetical protein